jgi:hypothetical protein
MTGYQCEIQRIRLLRDRLDEKLCMLLISFNGIN